jgi:phosphomannomutase
MPISNNNLLISISGIRGRIPEGLYPENILNFTLAFGTLIFLESKDKTDSKNVSKSGLKEKSTDNRETQVKNKKRPRIILGRDNRPTGKMFDSIIKGALISQGYEILDLGIVPTPCVKSVVIKKRADAGIMISASHNPVEWNAFKFISRDGSFISEKQIQKMMDIMESGKFKKNTYHSMGRVTVTMAYKKHIKEILELSKYTNLIKKKRFKIAIDAGGGAGSKVIPELLKKLNCKVYKINCSIVPEFPRPPEPVPASLNDLSCFVKKHGCHIGFAVDPDADRLAVVDEKGKPIGEELTLPLAMLTALDERDGDIVVNLSSSLLNEFVAQKFKKKVFRAKIGESNVVSEMIKNKAAFGGEGNGGVIDPKISSFGRDSLSGIVHILGTMTHYNQNVSQIVSAFPDYKIFKFKAPLDCTKNKIDIEILENHFRKKLGTNYNLDKRDGIHMNWGDYWLHIRKSNTEPILRFIFECLDKKTKDKIKLSIKEKFDI